MECEYFYLEYKNLLKCTLKEKGDTKGLVTLKAECRLSVPVFDSKSDFLNCRVK